MYNKLKKVTYEGSNPVSVLTKHKSERCAAADNVTFYASIVSNTSFIFLHFVFSTSLQDKYFFGGCPPMS